MFKEMRRKDRELNKEGSLDVLKAGEYGTLATVSENGYPYATPISYVVVDGSIYFHGALEGHKLENIKFNNKVSFSVVGKTKVLPDKFSTEYESVIVFGKVVEPSEEEKRQALMVFIDKYSLGFEKEGIEYINRAFAKTNVIKIEIEHITGKGRR